MGFRAWQAAEGLLMFWGAHEPTSALGTHHFAFSFGSRQGNPTQKPTSASGTQSFAQIGSREDVQRVNILKKLPELVFPRLCVCGMDRLGEH